MTTFKQFLIDSEGPLTELRMELFLQKKFNLTKDERKLVVKWVDGEVSDMVNRMAWIKMFDHYAEDMPNDIYKDTAPDFSAEEWVYQMVLHDLKDAGFKTYYQPDKTHRPRTAADPLPVSRYQDDY